MLEEKEKELEAMVGENRRICDGNEELKKRIELQVVEREIWDTEVVRNSWEEKSRDLDATIGHKFKELKALLIECNQRIKRFCSDDL